MPKFRNRKGLAATIQIALHRFCLLNAAQRKLGETIPARAKAGENTRSVAVNRKSTTQKFKPISVGLILLYGFPKIVGLF